MDKPMFNEFLQMHTLKRSVYFCVASELLSGLVFPSASPRALHRVRQEDKNKQPRRSSADKGRRHPLESPLFFVSTSSLAEFASDHSDSVCTVTMVSAKCVFTFSSIPEAILCASSTEVCLLKEQSMFM
jgi:hypothetical protein